MGKLRNGKGIATNTVSRVDKEPRMKPEIVRFENQKENGRMDVIVAGDDCRTVTAWVREYFGQDCTVKYLWSENFMEPMQFAFRLEGKK